MVDLVGDDADAAPGAVGGKTRELGARQHGPGGIGRARHDQPVDRSGNPLEQLGRRLEAGGKVGRQRDDLDSQRAQDVAVGRVAGIGHDHAITDVEGGEEGQDECAGRTGGHGDARGVDRDRVVGLVASGDGTPQRLQSERFGVAAGAVGQRRHGRLDSGRRRATTRFADLEMHHLGAAGSPSVGGRHHLHHDEGGDGAAARRLERRVITHVIMDPRHGLRGMPRSAQAVIAGWYAVNERNR